MGSKLTVRMDIGDPAEDRHLEFRNDKDRTEVAKLVEIIAGVPKDDKPVMFSIGQWQVYAVPTGD